MDKVLIDSSVFLSLFLRDSNHKKAAAMLESILQGKYKIILLDIVIGEIVSVLTRNNLSKEEILIKLDKIMSFEHEIHIVNCIETLDTIQFAASHVNLKSVDLFILTSSMVNQVDKFLTLDKKLEKAYKYIN